MRAPGGVSDPGFTRSILPVRVQSTGTETRRTSPISIRTAPAPVEVVLYTLTDAPLAHPALELRYQQPDSRGVDGYWLDYLLGRGGTLARNIDLGESLEEVAWSEPVEAPARDPTAFVLATSLTKLHGVLTREAVAGDILLEPSSRKGSYGGVVYRW